MPPISRSARPVDRIKWMLARVSHRWHCTSSPIPAVEALPDRRRRLRRAAVTFRSDRLGFGLGAIGLADGLLGARARLPGEFWRASNSATEKDLSRFSAHERSGKELARFRQFLSI